MKIVFPTLSRFPSITAPSVQVANMAQAFAEAGHDVTLVAPAPDPRLATMHPEGADGGEQLFGFHPRYATVVLADRVRRGQSYVNAIRIARMVREQRPDLVFSRDLRSCLLPARAGVPTVFEAHTLTSLQGPQERWVLERLTSMPAFRGVVAISSALAQDLHTILGVPEHLLHVAHDGVRLLPTSDVAEEGREDRPLRVGYSGSLFAGRGIELLLEVARRADWIELHVVGGPLESAAALQARTSDGRSGRIVVHGQRTPIEARRFQQQMDVLAAPFARRVSTNTGVDSSRWMSPMKVFEYMASGRPIVISDLPVLREVLRPDVDALMVPPEDPDALIAALERLRDDAQLGARLAASALDRVRNEFTWDIRARRILERFIPGVELRGSFP